MSVNIKGLQVAALLDTGSSINIISKSLFDKLPNNGKFNFRSGSEQTVKFVNKQHKLFDPHSLAWGEQCRSCVSDPNYARETKVRSQMNNGLHLLLINEINFRFRLDICHKNNLKFPYK